jgi:hypothetical protein
MQRKSEKMKKIDYYPLVKELGSPKKKGKSNGYSLSYTIARLVARYPSSEIYATLIMLHQSLSSFLKEVLPQQIEEAEHCKNWLIGALRGKSAGGFNTVKSLNKFLYENPEKIPSQRLITGLCALAACIGYRVRQKGYEGPFLSLNNLPDEQIKKNYLYCFLKSLDKLTKDNVVERLSLSFHDDLDEVKTINDKAIINKAPFYKNNDNYISDASEAEEQELIPDNPGNAHFLKLACEDGRSTWWGKLLKAVSILEITSLGQQP